MVSTCKSKHQHKRQLSQLNETLIDFVIGNNTNADVNGSDCLETQTSGFVNSFGSSTVGENSASQAQVLEENFAGKVRKDFDNAVVTVEY